MSEDRRRPAADEGEEARTGGDRHSGEGGDGDRGGRPLADRRPDQGAGPSPDEEIAAEDTPSPTDPAAYDRDEEGDEPPDYPTRA
ncbi:hypothetical protein FZ103_23750 [Streptomonospora sp. PA3]|uniref:hypothetical protein n=1 Tax=Streptomonospora sp. PA3 TaxID=2607326 RepID=UPI0012DC8876|nr:hypothetical protein [Streptomonospora sp. PA3]MUL44137.1 hypothetical protein [Streptomonospora sp. PA3]